MKNWISDHPYFWTSLIFLGIMLVGWQMLFWRAETFMFVLLLYFIVTLGIRLDDISRKIGGGGDNPRTTTADRENLIGQLDDIKVSIRALNATLNKLVEKMEKGGN